MAGASRPPSSHPTIARSCISVGPSIARRVTGTVRALLVAG
jgi:hypothetical protein